MSDWSPGLAPNGGSRAQIRILRDWLSLPGQSRDVAEVRRARGGGDGLAALTSCKKVRFPCSHGR
jgi:hypothetical protein